MVVDTGRYHEALDLHHEIIAEYGESGNLAELPKARQNLAWLLCKLERCVGAQVQIDAARGGLAPDDDLHVLLDVVAGAVALARGDVDGAVELLEGVVPRAKAIAVEAYPLLGPELAAGLARALVAQGKDLTRARVLSEQAREGYRALGRTWDAEEFERWLGAVGMMVTRP
jgi:hypothetical protein